MKIPRSRNGDETLALLRAPYDHVRDTCARLGSDLFETRLLLRRTVCMRGARAAALFYDEDRFIRSGAMPEPVRATLLGKGGVQGLDGEPHRVRKAMFMSLMTNDRVQELARLAEREWLSAIPSWVGRERLCLYDAIQPILMRAVCAWTGVPLPREDEARRTRDAAALFDRAAALGIGHIQARLARRRSERWLAALIEKVRNDGIKPPPDSALGTIASHQDASGRLLSPRIAAVELLNVLRPTVAVSVYITFIAHALHCFRDASPGDDSEAAVERFVQEVRRFYPFFPALIARARRQFEWEGIDFPAGRRVLLDLHATNRSDEWRDPDVFRPERFLDQPDDLFMFIPQGGSNHHRQHRCPGEAITLALMKMAAPMLIARLAYDVPEQNLRIDRSRMPALPADRFVISGVQLG